MGDRIMTADADNDPEYVYHKWAFIRSSNRDIVRRKCIRCGLLHERPRVFSYTKPYILTHTWTRDGVIIRNRGLIPLSCFKPGFIHGAGI